jgi:DNA mismatch endonuclease, patch repair protein
MSRVKQKHTKPEVTVRSLLHRMGFRFRLHRQDLPGTPDIVLVRHRKVVFVHGCFWHGHHCPRGKRPVTRREFWNLKLDRNIERDRGNQAALCAANWEFCVVWQCELKDIEKLAEKLLNYLEDSDDATSTPG